MTFIEKQQELAIKSGKFINEDQVCFYRNELDTLITQIIQNTGVELMRLASELENKYQNDPVAVAAGMEDIKLNAIEDFKETITNLTGAN